VSNVLTVFGIALVVTSLVTLVAGVHRSRRQPGPVHALAPTMLFALGVMLLCVGWLTSAGVPATASEAIRSGALASAAVLALYALWLNDQRRRTEQERLEKEKAQFGLERLRISDERFTKAIELLGNDSDRVRIGALIQLDGLTRTRPDLIPDVVDQLCGYLRGPVDLGSSTELAVEQERRVRRHAQRVLGVMLRRATEETPIAEVDLSGAALQEFRLDGGAVGTLRLDDTRLIGPTTLRDVRVGVLTMKDCTADDDVLLEDGLVGKLVIHGRNTRIGGRFRCRCRLGSVDIEAANFEDTVELSNLVVEGQFAAHANFRRLSLTQVVFAAPAGASDGTSIDLFQCEFGGLVLFEEVDVYGVVRFAGVRFMDGLRLGARFYHRVTVEEALLRGDVQLPVRWRLEEHDAEYRRLVAPKR
jgi:hypothetical protein